MQQFPSSFEFTEILLLNIADSLYSCQYGTFLLNSDEIRREMRTSEFTMSAWTTILDNSNIFLNRNFNEKTQNDVLQQSSAAILSVKIWENYYHRYLVDPCQIPVRRRAFSLDTG